MDDYFNSVAAAKVYDLVMGMPEPDAREFVKHVVYGMLHEQIEGNRRTVVSKVNQINQELLEAAVRTSVRDELVPAIAAVSKSWETIEKKNWDERERKRDEKGRFSRYERRTGKPGKYTSNKDYKANAAFDLVETLGGSQGAATSTGQFVHGVNRGGSSFENKWFEASAGDSSTNARTYRRIQAGSQLLGQVSAAPQAQIAAGLGEFVGEYGPMAEKVLGPHARRTAYRYRGTEKQPDPGLIKMANEQVVREVTPRLPSNASSQKLAEARRDAVSNITPEQRMVAATTASIGYFRDRLPELELSDLQQKSGRIPPSEGVILDRNGKMVAQASGFADDHYLPFNLRNLQELKGGSYVRTRTTGGLTTEDIYTGLMSGAREVSVVSHSGIFTITFEDDFRGARRYSDKAKSMVDRYGKTLDAIKSGRAEREKIDIRTKADIRTEVEEELGPIGATRPEIEVEYKRRLEQFQRSPELRASELNAIAARAKEAGGGDARKEAMAYNDMLEQAEQNRLNRHYKLDGEGYAAAIRALKEQYPYYIKDTSYFTHQQAKDFGEKHRDYSKEPNGPPEHLRQMGFKRTTDAGYVAPNYQRPEKAMEGYWDPNIAGAGKEAGTGKTPAAFTNYANWAHNPTRGAKSEAATTGVKEEPGKATPKLASQSLRAAEEQRKVEIETNNSVKSLVKNIGDVGPVPSRYTELNAAITGNQLDDILQNSERRTKMLQEVISMTSYNISNAPNDEMKAQASALKRQADEVLLKTQMGVSGAPWTKDKLGHSQRTPYGFDEKGFRPGDPPELTQTRLNELDAHFAKLTGTSQSLSELDDSKLREMAVSAGRTAQTFQSNGDISRAVVEMAEVKYGGQATDAQKAAMYSYFSQHKDDAAKQSAQLAELAEKARTLKHRLAQNPGSHGGGKPKAAAAAPAAQVTSGPSPISRQKVYDQGYNIDDERDLENLESDLFMLVKNAGVRESDITTLSQAIREDDGDTASSIASRLLMQHGSVLQEPDRLLLLAFNKS